MTASTQSDSGAARKDDAPAIEIETLRFLIGALATNQVWHWLSDRERTSLRSEITKGFKSAPGVLRHGLAQTRFARHLQRNDEDLRSLLALWAASQGELLHEIRSHLPPGNLHEARVLAPDETTSEAISDDAKPQSKTQNAASEIHSGTISDGGALQVTTQDEANETRSVTAEESPKNLETQSQNATEKCDLPEEILLALRARFGEHSLRLAQLYLGYASGESEAAMPKTAVPQASFAGEKTGASTRDTQNEASKREAEQQLLRRRLEETKTAHDAHRRRASELASEIESSKANHQRELIALRAQLVKSQKDAETQRANAAAAQKNLERETRRAKQDATQRETFAAENKRLKRQIRQLQESAEDARKTAATANAQLQSTQETIELLRRELETLQDAAKNASSLPASTHSARKAAKAPLPRAERVPIEPKKVVSIAPRVLDPLDEVFRWNADGRDFAVTLRETREMISRNSEARVFALSRALETLRESDEKTYFNFLNRVRDFGSYFRRVLTVSTTRVLVDASNVARIETDRRGRGKLDFLLQAREELRRRDAFPLLLIADASLQHFIDEPEEVAKMAKRGELELLPAGNVADDFLAREARRTGAFVLTNDKGFHKQVAPDFEPSRVGFRLRHNFIEIDDF